MNVHLCINDKYVQNFIELTFELGLIGDNIFIVYGPPENRFTKQFDHPHIVFTEALASYEPLDKLVRSADGLYIHYLSDEVVDFLYDKTTLPAKIVWILWGADGFSLPELRGKFKRLNKEGIIKKLYAETLGKLRLTWNNPSLARRKAVLKRINYMAHYLHDDYLMLRRFMHQDSQFIFFTYGLTDQLVFRDLKAGGDSILIGNSADRTNNHLYVLQNVIPTGINKKIIIPLSYGGDKDYINDVVRCSQERFNGKSQPLLSMLSLEEYMYDVLAESRYAIMCHERSQAWGNIMHLLWQGTKVFMYHNSTLYKYLRGQGFTVFGISGRLATGDFTPVTESEMNNNRSLLEKYFSKPAVMEHNRKLLTV